MISLLQEGSSAGLPSMTCLSHRLPSCSRFSFCSACSCSLRSRSTFVSELGMKKPSFSLKWSLSLKIALTRAET